uniref:Uncharacterized protein n=1 Tax=Peronospora matthiolae TaxID=2874970 RepID=A0AAV1UTF4_9STRA
MVSAKESVEAPIAAAPSWCTARPTVRIPRDQNAADATWSPLQSCGAGPAPHGSEQQHAREQITGQKPCPTRLSGASPLAETLACKSCTKRASSSRYLSSTAGFNCVPQRIDTAYPSYWR